jgi:nucleoside-diphosphate-sugar epimerase
MKCLSLRLTNTYGPRQHLKGNNQGFAGIFIRKAINGEEIQIFGDGKQLRDFNYIDDVVDAFILATDNLALYGKEFNLGAEIYHTLVNFVEILKKYCSFEYKTVTFPADHKKIDVGDYYGDFKLFNSLTGWKPKIDLEEGLKKTITYFKSRQNYYW